MKTSDVRQKAVVSKAVRLKKKRSRHPSKWMGTLLTECAQALRLGRARFHGSMEGTALAGKAGSLCSN